MTADACYRIACRLRDAGQPLSAHELVRRHSADLDGCDIENHHAGYRVRRHLRDLQRAGLVTTVAPTVIGDPVRWHWTAPETAA